jgi:multimeric flavodoxin WrbA
VQWNKAQARQARKFGSAKCVNSLLMAIVSNQGWAAHRLESQHVPEATLDDLAWADAIIFGTPTRYGLPTAQLKTIP